jgi:hypothetical protein
MNPDAKLAIYGTMIYTAPYVMFLMRADPLRGQVSGGWALKWQRAERVPFEPKKVEICNSFVIPSSFYA